MSVDKVGTVELYDVDKAILGELERCHGEGSVFSEDLAFAISDSVNVIRTRLGVLKRVGLVEQVKWREDGRSWTGWTLTNDGVQKGPWT